MTTKKPPVPIPSSPGPPPAIKLTQEEINTIAELSPGDWADFQIALNIATLIATGKSIVDACATYSVDRSTFYSDRWQGLLARARTMITRQTLSLSTNAINHVLAAWPEILTSMINVARSATNENARVAAAEFLQEHIIAPFQGATQDNNDQKSYLAESRNFNPFKVLREEKEEEPKTMTVSRSS